jgi:ATP adenylyltransferase
MNRYPYNNGHLMVVPLRHTATLSGWNSDEQAEMMQLAELSTKVLEKTMKPDGFNLGINMGLVAGAGVADHIHLHIVPRWNGDTNFMPVFSDTRVISEALSATYKKLLEEFPK